ncbi:MAG: hypothetical protein LBG28_14820, partial [Tannerella sp.]|nr:hypothetical protein [Tannerella sp.]
MKKYVMTSPAFEGEIIFGFDGETGLLRELEVPVELGQMQHSFLMRHLPATTVEMRKFQILLKEMKSPAKIKE